MSDAQSQDHIDAVVAMLEAWQEKIASALETLRYLQTQGTALPSTLPVGRTNAQQLAHDTFFQMTIPDAAKKYLTIVKKTKTVAEIAQALLEGGLKSSSTNFTENVRTIIAREDRFVRVNGEWGLSEWYPAMKRERKAPIKPERPHKKASKQQSAVESLPSRILRLLQDHPEQAFSAEDVASRLSAKVDSVRARLTALSAGGHAKRPERGMYQANGGNKAA